MSRIGGHPILTIFMPPQQARNTMSNDAKGRQTTENSDSRFSPWQISGAIQEYCADATQRWAMLLDVLRQRGNNYLERTRQTVPHVLSFEAELILDGRR